MLRRKVTRSIATVFAVAMLASACGRSVNDKGNGTPSASGGDIASLATTTPA